jgi:hypothetical protein
MLGKILLTAAVVCIAFFVIRQRHIAEHPRVDSAGGKQSGSKAKTGDKGAARQTVDNGDPGLARDLRIGAYLFLIMMVGLAGVMYYFQWHDDRTVITVSLFRDGAQEPVTYEVYKYQLGERSFTTVDGVAVTVAASERMEIEGLGN